VWGASGLLLAAIPPKKTRKVLEVGIRPSSIPPV